MQFVISLLKDIEMWDSAIIEGDRSKAKDTLSTAESQVLTLECESQKMD